MGVNLPINNINNNIKNNNRNFGRRNNTHLQPYNYNPVNSINSGIYMNMFQENEQISEKNDSETNNDNEVECNSTLLSPMRPGRDPIRDTKNDDITNNNVFRQLRCSTDEISILTLTS